ncbi:hypothetical protein BpHYR1_004116 [Brachionus plicatilis]|uniref:Uncharacterized protein n=1 Tax=Brachionus plicatilis TaxID=10195 RepID=A0A3M7R0Z3_BRAPC|nr:hypothetical protein BpHYR1_004116 [Brachionus plicatilis]
MSTLERWQLCILVRLSIISLCEYGTELYVCCQRILKGDLKAKDLKQLENKTRTCLSNMDPKVIQDHGKNVHTRLDIICHFASFDITRTNIIGAMNFRFF